MWMLKFCKAYAKNKGLKRMLAYWGRMKQPHRRKQCTGYGTDLNRYVKKRLFPILSVSAMFPLLRAGMYQCRIMQDCAGLCHKLDNRQRRKVHLVLAELDTEIKIRNPVRCFYGNPYYPQAGWYCAGCGERKEPVQYRDCGRGWGKCLWWEWF